MYDAVYSDPHFGHANIIRYCSRPFLNADEMNRELVRRYNATVAADETVLWLGDCFFLRPDDAARVLARMNGRKILVCGNHDKGRDRMLGIGFSEVHSFGESVAFEAGGYRFRASHLPYDDDRFPSKCPPRMDDEYLLHGHTHQRWRRAPGSRAIHCGVDAWGYRPARMSEILGMLP